MYFLQIPRISDAFNYHAELEFRATLKTEHIFH